MVDVQVFFITNRDHQPHNKQLVFGGQFNSDGVAALRFGNALFTLSADGNPELKDVFVYPEHSDIDKASFTVVGSRDFLSDLKATMTGSVQDTLVFIHGFNVSFLEALRAGARLAHNLAERGTPVNLVVFTWPSDGKMVPYMSYYSDRDDARASAAAVARAFLKLKEFIEKLPRDDYCNRSVHLLAHSMGNYVLRNGLQALIAKDERGLVRLFDQIILAAADEDDDAFETDQKLRLLPRIGRQITVYHNGNDRALIVSDRTKGNPDRLGSDGPRLIDMIPKKVTVVDCRALRLDGDEMTRHSYYLSSAAVCADLRHILEGMDAEVIPNRKWVREKRAYRIFDETDDEN